MSRLRVLTFNFHEPYLCLMAKTGIDFTVGLYSRPPRARPWQTQFRPIPPNMKLVEERTWRSLLRAGRFDVVVAHEESNALDVLKCDTPKILICHNRLTFLRETATADVPDVPGLIQEVLALLQARFSFVFISESKRDDYGIPGAVIRPGIDVEEYGGYSGETPEVLRVGNMMRSRNQMFDVDFQERVCSGIPNRVLGVDPKIPGAKPADSFDGLLHFYRSRRCLLHVTREEYEDGYNLSTLEAMACGMPVVALGNRTSPLTDGVDGYVSRDADELRERLQLLLKEPDLARELGARGRETVAAKFPMSAFVENWRNALERAADEGRRGTRRSRPAKTPSQSILMHYVASPITTARYFEQAARKKHHVVSAGLQCPERVLEGWGFRMPAPPYAAHDIDLPLETTYREIVRRLPSEFAPALYLWIDSGVKNIPSDIEALQCPKACYLIDTHIEPELRLAIARRFDYTFLAQKAQVELFRHEGISNVQWLPLACSPELHAVGQPERNCDVAYVGGFSGDAQDRRRNLLSRIAARFPNSVIGRYWPGELADIYARSRIVVNACVSRDVNMRVFEGMASGALLITDEADGLDDLFEDRKHLVIYRNDEEVFDLIDYYLKHEDERARIAAAGAAEVYEKHTYERRIQEILDTVERTPIVVGGFQGESRFKSGGYYRNTRPEVAQHVPRSTRRLLDVGCGGGDFGYALKQRGLNEVHGIELVERACNDARKVLDSALLGNIEEMDLPYEDGYFDCITFSDVLEHLRDPVSALKKAARVLASDGTMVMSIPNVRFHQVLTMLLDGRWKYEDAGILDRTHLRFFTATDMYAMVKEADLEPLCIQALSYVTEEQLPRDKDGCVMLGRAKFQTLDEQDYSDLRTYQYLVIAGKPGVDRLAKARAALNIKENEAALLLAEEARGVDECDRRKVMAVASARLGQLTNAERLYREALSSREDDAEAAGELGILYIAMNRAGEAKPLLEKAHAADPDNERVTGALGLCHLIDGQCEAAFNCFVTALDSSYDGASLVPHLVAVATQLGRLSEVEGLVRRYADFHAGDKTLAYCHADLLAALGRKAEARERMEMTLLLSPNDAGALERLARLDNGHATP